VHQSQRNFPSPKVEKSSVFAILLCPPQAPPHLDSPSLGDQGDKDWPVPSVQGGSPFIRAGDLTAEAGPSPAPCFFIPFALNVGYQPEGTAATAKLRHRIAFYTQKIVPQKYGEAFSSGFGVLEGRSVLLYHYYFLKASLL
jgi:hypothetical protein